MYIRKAFIGLLIAGLGIGLVPFQQVGAVTAADWRAGNIMDDAVFTNKRAMSVAQIQSWLNTRLKNCDYNGTQRSELGGGIDYDRNGTVTRAEWARTKGYPTKFTCLNMYYEVPKTSPTAGIPASNYATSAKPSGSKSAAQLIYDAAQAYNISPKVLLVKLGTESAGPLTSDVWPLHSQYRYAMGARCPDSGPGGSANCDTKYAGFSIQMREAASLMRWYLDNMQQSWWSYKKPYKTNYILWNVVERNCGGRNVYIENKATAALYTYTPYQPNAAALRNMYGTGDNCSAYGNRNFWRVYNDWFGSSVYFIQGSIRERYNKIDGSKSLGAPVSNEKTLSSGGKYQQFENGRIYWKSDIGAWETKGSIGSRYYSTSGTSGPLGYPINREITLSKGRIYQQFEKGRVYWVKGSGTFGVYGSIGERYNTISNHSSRLGLPMGGERSLSTGGRYQQFEKGKIYWKKDVGSWDVSGSIGNRYNQLRGSNSSLGYPTGKETSIAAGKKFQQFENGRVYWQKSSGVQTLSGSIGSRYQTVTYHLGRLGLPLSNEISLSSGGKYQKFEKGRIYWKTTSGAWDTGGSIGARYYASGGTSGSLKYPTSSEVRSSSGITQEFENGSIRYRDGKTALLLN